jgi:ubiquinone/menaquinone biosynthesis C-methylase UbiE
MGGIGLTAELETAAAERRDAVVNLIFAASLGALELQAVYLGDRLGLYRALADQGPATAPELAARAGIDARYAREWLEQQAAAGILDVDDLEAGADDRRFSLPTGLEGVFLEPDSEYLVGPLARFAIGTAQTLPAVMDAFRTGAGVDWADYGPDVVEAQEALNRPQFAAHVGEWIADLPDIAERLSAGGRVADVACGTGWSSISIARAFDRAHVHGIDIDHGSIERANAHLATTEVGDRVRFVHADGAAAVGAGRYDLVTIFEAIHDMSQPAKVLATAKALLAPGGAVLIGDERTQDTFTAPADEMERFFYGFSVVGCLPNALIDQPSAATGTVIRASTMEQYAREAGFSGFTVLPTEHAQFRFYRLDP